MKPGGSSNMVSKSSNHSVANLSLITVTGVEACIHHSNGGVHQIILLKASSEFIIG